jgi:hypothetical protein
VHNACISSRMRDDHRLLGDLLVAHRYVGIEPSNTRFVVMGMVTETIWEIKRGAMLTVITEA